MVRTPLGGIAVAAGTGLAELDVIVVTPVEDFRELRRSDIKDLVPGTLQTLEQSLDNLVSSRIDALENKLLELSASLADLSHRASRTDMNLQKLVNAVERLWAQRAPAQPPQAASEPASALDVGLEPWEDQYLRIIRYRWSSRLKQGLYAGASRP